LATLLWLVLAGLTALLSLARLAALLLAVLPGLTTLLALSVLVALLTLFLHIVCHEIFLLKKARVFPSPSEFIALHSLVAARDCKGWEVFWRH
jgi:hypothetical protein